MSLDSFNLKIEGNKMNVDVGGISRATGIPTVTICYVLGLPNPELEALKERQKNAATAHEALEVYCQAPDGSELETEARKKLESLLLVELNAATTVKQAWKVAKQAPDGSTVQVAARAKVESLLRVELSSAVTFAEALEVYKQSGRGNSDLCVKSLEKMLELASNTGEALEIFTGAPFPLGYPIRVAALEKALALASTADEALKVAEKSFNDSNFYKLHSVALEKALALASTADELVTVQHRTPSRSPLKLAALRKLAKFFTKP
jgi:hypothetical protein